MPSQIALLVFVAGIVALFILERRDNKQRTSLALWLPAVYFFIIASRPVSAWFGGGIASAQYLQDGSPLDAAVYAMLYALAAVVLVQRRARVIKLLRHSWPVLLFCLYCLISLIWSDYPLVALKRWVKLLGDLMIALIVLSDSNPVHALKRLLAWTGFVLLPVSVLFIKYYPHLGKDYDAWTGAQYFQGISYNKNGLGAICLYWGVGWVWLLTNTLTEWPRRRRPALIAAAVLAMSVWLLSKSSSATSLSCFVMGTILIVMARSRAISRMPALIHCAAFAMIGVAFGALFLDRSALGLLQRDSTLTGRTELWDAIFKIPVNPIVGAGYESFWTGWRIEALWKIYWWRPTQAHNGFIEIFINLGSVGLALVALMLFIAYSRAIKAIRRREAWGGLLLAYSVIIIPYNFTEATIRVQNLPWLFVLLALVGIPAVRARRQVVPADVNGLRTLSVDGGWSQRRSREMVEESIE
jgi:exopolysaccharide production protein ExoQ